MMIFNVPRRYNFVSSLEQVISSNFSNDLPKLKIFFPNHRASQAFYDLIKKLPTGLYQSSSKLEQNPALVYQETPQCRNADHSARKKFYQNPKDYGMLPKVKAIADLDLNDFIDFLPNFEVAEFISKSLKIKVLEDVESIFFLAKEVQKLGIFGKLNFERAYKIAIKLKEFCDDVENNQIEPSALSFLDDSVMSIHRQINLKFLQDFFTKISHSLELQDMMLVSQYRNFLSKNFCKFLKTYGSSFPIIIAGSTGSLKSSQNLMQAVLNLKNGCVVVYGYDYKTAKTCHKHQPQFLLEGLLNFLAVNPIQIQEFKASNLSDLALEEEENYLQNLKEKLISLLFVADEDAKNWQNELKSEIKISSDKIGIELLCAKNEIDEAFKIADVIEETISKNSKENNQTTTSQKSRIAVVCNNELVRNLLVLELKKRGIPYNNALNCNLKGDKLINFLVLLFAIAFEEFNPNAFLALLKNHYCALLRTCDERGSAENAAEIAAKNRDFEQVLSNIEIKILRCELGKTTLDQLIKKISSPQTFDSNESKPITLKNEREFLRKIQDLLPSSKSLNSIITSLEQFSGSKFSQILAQHKAGKEIWKFFNQLQNCNYNPSSSKELDFMLSQIIFFEKKSDSIQSYQEDQAVDLLSSIEIRLLSYDFLIVSSLNEGSFPIQTSEGWIGSKLKKDLKIDKSTIRLGQNAFDFCNFLSQKRVLLSFTKRVQGNEKALSPFLIKLLALFSKAGIEVKYRSNSDKSDSSQNKNLQAQLSFDFNSSFTSIFPNPKPKNCYRPHYYSITEVSNLIANPYAIYVKKILKLSPLKEIDYQPGNLEFGNLIHKVLENYIKKEAEEKLSKKQSFDDSLNNSELKDSSKNLKNCLVSRFQASQIRQHSLVSEAKLIKKYGEQGNAENSVERAIEVRGNKQLLKRLLIDLDFANLLPKFFYSAESQLIWLPKFYNVFKDFIKANQQFYNCFSAVEFRAKTELNFLVNNKKEQVFLSGVIDRIIFNPKKNSLQIIDYKTGKPPSNKDVLLGNQPQLTISAFILCDEINRKNLLENLSFCDLKNHATTNDFCDSNPEIINLAYWHLSRNESSKIREIFAKNEDLQRAIAEVKPGLIKLFSYFLDEKNGFFATSKIKGNRQIGDSANPLWKLSRDEEWQNL